MNAKKLSGALLTIGLTLAAVAPPAQVQAKGKDAPAATSDPPVVKKALAMPLPGVVWGQAPKQVGEAVDKILDDDYRPKYKEVQPGIRMRELDAALAEEKSQFRRSRIDFGKLPTGLDATPLRGEYTYNNKEAMMVFARNGEVFNMFFIQERLWKIIDEKKLSDSSPLGKNYQDAVIKMSTNFGIPGRVVAPDGTTHFALEVDWKDATSHLRAIMRSETAMGLGYEDNAMLAQLASLRTNKPTQDSGIDPDVAAAIRSPSPDPGPPPDKDKGKKK